MLAKENPDIQAAIGTVYQLSRDEKIRQQCEAREDFYRRELDRQLQNEHMKEMEQEIAQNLKKLLLGSKELAQGQQELAQGQQELTQNQQKLAQDKQVLAQEKQKIEESKIMLHEWELAIEKKIQALEKISESESN